jgi:hypothetical protein
VTPEEAAFLADGTIDGLPALEEQLRLFERQVMPGLGW